MNCGPGTVRLLVIQHPLGGLALGVGMLVDGAVAYDGPPGPPLSQPDLLEQGGLVIPELAGKLDGMAFRVPTPTVSVCDFVATLERPVTKDEVNDAFKDAATESLRGILGYCDEPLVSTDFKGDPRSSIVDALSTLVLDGNLVKAVSWYDNEWGYSCRVADLSALIADRGF